LIAKQIIHADLLNLLNFNKYNKTLNNLELKKVRIISAFDFVDLALAKSGALALTKALKYGLFFCSSEKRDDNDSSIEDYDSSIDDNDSSIEDSSIFEPDLTDLYPELPNDEAILNKIRQFIDGTKTKLDINTALDPTSSNNAYFVFIEQARKAAIYLLTLNPNIEVQIHHILPIHAGGTNESSNLVKLTFNDHLVAHYIRWLVYKNNNDRIAYQCMLGQVDEETRRLRASKGGTIGGPIAQSIFRKTGRGWFDIKGQSERGKKGAEVNRRNGCLGSK